MVSLPFPSFCLPSFVEATTPRGVVVDPEGREAFVFPTRGQTGIAGVGVAASR
jgi:hypothetical protein